MIDQKFLESLGVTDESTVQKITETYTADIKAEQDAATATKTQLDEANKTIQSYKDMDIDGIQQSAADWQKKYEQAEADRKAKEYRDNVAAFVRKQGMKNDVYAEYLTNQIISKQLQFDDKGNLTGGTETVQELKKTCPDAFAAEEPPKPFLGSAQGFPSTGDAFDKRLRKVMGLPTDNK